MSLDNINLYLKGDNGIGTALNVCEELDNIEITELINAEINLEELILKLSSRSLDGVKVNSKVNDLIDKLWQSLNNEEECVENMIKVIEPLLIKKPRLTEKQKRLKGLNPKLGFSLGEDDIYEEWKRKGGIESIPICFVILKHLKISQISKNLWWIIPFIFNLLDDTSDLHGVRMPAVLLLRTMLNSIFYEQHSDKWMAFKDTGLFEEYENMLVNFCFYLPPSYDAAETLKIWETVIPTIQVLYKTQYIQDTARQKMHIQKFLGEVILQNCLLRCGCKYENLTTYLLRTIRVGFSYLGEDSIALLQRLIYDMGQYLIKDPFFTAFEPLMHEVTCTIEYTIQANNEKRIIAHKYDFLGLILLIYGKLKFEEQEKSIVMEELRDIVGMLNKIGCNFNEDIQHLKDINDIDYSQLLL
uniref:Uncharacterized protein yjr136C n=1 Tax=Nakaseomyces delphensis TaxID=51657 RepID=A7WPE5_NAKDE|nr:hypothetical protein [Nakaseomyces delphensis]